MSRIEDLDVVHVDLGPDRSYPIYIGSDIINDGKLFLRHLDCKKVLIVTNDRVGPLYLDIIKQTLTLKPSLEVFEVILPDGEAFKTMESVLTVIDAAVVSKLDRKSCMIALGGGVIGDMTGFAAAIYQRGIKFIQIPTTVMAMVDSAVGGKTAVNHAKGGKNLIGSFYQPDAVVIDINTLSSLPDREFNSGLSEVIKYGLIRDSDFFQWLELNIENVMRRDHNALNEVFRRSCENKAEVVKADEKESGLRATLNLGHTFGHAIEAGLGYGVWLHGEAVSVGIAMAAEMSYELGWIEKDLLNRILSLLEKCNLPITLINAHALYDLGVDEYRELVRSLSEQKFFELMSIDKKVANGRLNLILLRGKLGQSVVTDDFDTNILHKIIHKYCSYP